MNETPKYRAQVWRRDDGRFDWRITHRNGQIVATSHSQGYERRSIAVRSLARLAAAFRAGDVFMEVDALGAD